MDIAELLRAADNRSSVREALIETITLAVARRGGFDGILGLGPNTDRTWTARMRGFPDVAGYDENVYFGGIEVKVCSQVNAPRDGYAGCGCETQLEHFTHQGGLIIITSTHRQTDCEFPSTATVMTLSELADVAARLGIASGEILATELDS